MQTIKRFFGHIEKDFLDSFASFRGSLYEIAFPLLSDLLLIFLYGLLVTFFVDKVSIAIYKIGVIASGADIQTQTTLSEIFIQPSTMPYIYQLLLWLFLMIASFYILYSISQSISWFCCRKIALRGQKKHQQSLLAFLKQFSVLTLPWYLFFVLFNLISVLNEVFVKQDVIGYLNGFMLIVIFYFASISYSLIGRFRPWQNIRKSFEIGFEKIIYLIPVCLSIFALFFLIDLVMGRLLMINNILFIIFGIIILLPAISWARIYIMLTVTRLSDRNS